MHFTYSNTHRIHCQLGLGEFLVVLALSSYLPGTSQNDAPAVP